MSLIRPLTPPLARPDPAPGEGRALHLHFGSPGTGLGAPTIAIPHLAGLDRESLGGRGLDFGYEVEPVAEGQLEAATFALYQRLLRRAAGRHLCRVWNYVPAINGSTGQPPLENYRRFCRARAQSFEAEWGAAFTARLPAASAVGGEPGRLLVVFATSEAVPIALENPEQVPAYEYPIEHGPRPPSFSRALRVRGTDREWVFISGTAAIKGHHTVAPGQLQPQIDCMLHNLALIGLAAQVGDDLGAAQGWHRSFKVYLRQAEDLPIARQHLQEQLLREPDETVWLQADICRSDLVIEVEATLHRPLTPVS